MFCFPTTPGKVAFRTHVGVKTPEVSFQWAVRPPSSAHPEGQAWDACVGGTAPGVPGDSSSVSPPPVLENEETEA